MFPFQRKDRQARKKPKAPTKRKYPYGYEPPVVINLDEGAIELSDDRTLAPIVAPPTPSSSTVTTPVVQQPKPVVGSIKPVPLVLLQKESTPAPAPEPTAKKILFQHQDSKNKVWANKDKVHVVAGSRRSFYEAVATSRGIQLAPPLSKRARKRAAKEARDLQAQVKSAQSLAPETYPKGNAKGNQLQKRKPVASLLPLPRTVVPIQLQPEYQPPQFEYQAPPVEEVMDRNATQWGPGASSYAKGVAGIPKSFLKAAEAVEIREGSESPELGEKRLSAFDRLGPLTQPKKPKLTINLLFSKEQAPNIREVVKVENKVKKYIPVHKREEILTSTHEVIIKYLAIWPWKVDIKERKTVGPRESKTAMLMEEEQMTEYYEMPTTFIKVMIKHCPKQFEKEDVLDLILEQLKDYSFIPSFIDMQNGNCSFLVIKCPEALFALHKLGLRIQLGEQSLPVYISATYIKQNFLNNFVPKLILRKMVLMAYDQRAKSLNLRKFSLQPDISNFIYFPLKRIQNQIEFLQIQSVQLSNIVELNLSHNRLTSVDGFNLGFAARRLKRLDLSFNYLEKMTTLLQCRNLLLDSLRLEGNPLCNDYTDPDHYKRTAHLLFPTLKELDGIKIKKCDEMPSLLQTFCPPDAKELIEKFLQTFFPILDSTSEDRMSLSDMYYEDAVLTITFRSRLRSASIFRYGREMFSRARCFEEGNADEIAGAKAIAKNYTRWPKLRHDSVSFTIDVLLHEEFTTIFRVGGIMKAASERLADDEHLLGFTRTFVIHSADGVEYKIHNEMLFFDEPSRQCLEKAFQVNTMARHPVIKFDSNPDSAVKESLIVMLSDLTELGKKQSERCLSQKNWDLRAALEYFMALLKLNSVNTLDQD